MGRGTRIIIAVVFTVLGAGSAFALNLGLGWLVQAPGPVQSAPTVASSGRAPTVSRPRVLTVEQYLDGLMGRNLFDKALSEAWARRNPGPVGASAGTRSELKVKLLGTFVAEPATFSSALIADEDVEGMPLGYSIGDKLHDREVVTIEYERVTLKRPDGTIEVLTMGDGELVTSAGADPTAEPSGEDGVEQAGDNKFVVSKDTFDKYINDMEGISRMGRALLHRGPDGEYDGYRLSAIRRNTLADQLGIKNGDIIHSVNGEPLNSMQSAMGAYNTMRSQSNFCFEISRRGSPMELCYEVR